MRSRLLAIALLVLTFTVSGLQVPDADAELTPPVVSKRIEGFTPEDGLGTQASDAATTSTVTEAPIPFSMIGFEVPSGAEISFRTSVDGQEWTSWEEAHAEGDHAPEAGSAEAAGAAAASEQRWSEPSWVGNARFVQVQATGAGLGDVTAGVIDSLGLTRNVAERAVDAVRTAWRGTAQPAHAGHARPALVSRAGWGADESMRNCGPEYASKVRYGVLHHTATSNYYTPSEAPGVVRGIYAYHTQYNGWCDIGYNFLVDRYGRIYVGRYGGIRDGVIGAHAKGFNTGSFGVAVIGDFSWSTPPWAARNSVAKLVGWKFSLHEINPGGTITITSGGNERFPAGTKVVRRTLFGHRDTGATSCPGDVLYGFLPELRAQVWPLSWVFHDIGGSPHRFDIRALYNDGITAGCAEGLYCPRRIVRRGQMATFLVKSANIAGSGKNQFVDDNNSIYEPDINALATAGVTQGCDQTPARYCPAARVTRGQMATFIAKTFKLPGTTKDFFVDDNSSIHEYDINRLAAAGISAGCDTSPARYCPGASVTREQMATFLVNARK